MIMSVCVNGGGPLYYNITDAETSTVFVIRYSNWNPTAPASSNFLVPTDCPAGRPKAEALGFSFDWLRNKYTH
jgi:hypothetical protein